MQPDFGTRMLTPSREQLLQSLYEAAELEHDLMCTYLYAAFTIKTDPADGITVAQAARASEWRRAIIHVAIEEMAHLTAVWNITSALGASPRFGRGNFPIDVGPLPGWVVARLAPFEEDVLQHFVYLERAGSSREGDGDGFPHAPPRRRVTPFASLTPMSTECETVAEFYATLDRGLRAFVERHGEEETFCNDPALQLTTEDVGLPGLTAVQCSKTVFSTLRSIVEQGEGAPVDHPSSHFHVFLRVRDELAAARLEDPTYAPAFPAARDPVLRPPIREGRVWIADPEAAATVDLANAIYNLMLRMLAYSYQVPRGVSERRVAIECALGLMHAMTPIAERAVRLPIGPAHAGLNAGMTFTAPRDAAPLPRGAGAWRLFNERFDELVDVASSIATSSKDARSARALRALSGLRARAQRVMLAAMTGPALPSAKEVPAPTAHEEERPPASPSPQTPGAAHAPDRAASLVTSGRRSEGRALAVLYDGKRCIHARQCVTGDPKVFVANVTKGPWIHPDEAAPESVIEIIHRCPSGALRYERADGKPEPAPLVNVIAIRERGPYVVRADIELAGAPAGYRLTLCRCGASKNKPFCDNSHRDIAFDATGEPPATSSDPFAERAGALAIEPTIDGPLEITGNLEITTGSGRTVARVTRATLCRCGASAQKPFCDQSHLRIGFRSEA
jgi:CDGSH-type Zn-finger protein/uncharacterized Fe-S cluster protein YjdI